MEKTFNPYLITAALECAKQNPDGFTISPDMTEQPTQGYAVALSHLELKNKGIVGFLQILSWCLEHGYHFGGWKDKETGIVHWDAVQIFEEGQLKQAAWAAYVNDQIAFFDLGNGVEIRTNLFHGDEEDEE